jgi:hypothetical protein
MEKFDTEEVKEIIKMLKAINAEVKRAKTAEPTRLEKQIRYLEQRLKFFNPTKDMLAYIIGQAEHSKIKLDPILLEKLRSEFARVIQTSNL